MTGRNFRAKDNELAASLAKVDALNEEATRLKRQLDSAQASNMIKILLLGMKLFFLHAVQVYSFVITSILKMSRVFVPEY